MAEGSNNQLLPLQIASAVHGPTSLREDIADEIADHLACRTEEEPCEDPATAQAAAIRAFGDPYRTARELRAIHLGDLIMFQRIMVAALVVIVAGMATTAYFSWSAARRSSEQAAEMNERLVSLMEQQLAPEPAEEEPPLPMVRLKIYCGIAPSDEPARGHTVHLTHEGQEPVKPGTYQTDATGWVTTEPLKTGRYVLTSSPPDLNPGTSDTTAGTRWYFSLKPEDGKSKEVHITVGSRCVHQLTIDIPEALSWDREAMNSARIRFIDNVTRMSYRSEVYPVQLFESNRIPGLLPGPAKAELLLPNLVKRWSNGDEEPVNTPNTWYNLGEVEIPAENGPVTAKLELAPKEQITGIIYDGSRDKPVANTRITLEFELGSKKEPRASGPRRTPTSSISYYLIGTEVLRTDDEGRFTALRMRSVSPGGRPPSPPHVGMSISWHTPDGKALSLYWPPASPPVKSFKIATGGTFYDIDMSTLAAMRLKFTGVDNLSALGKRIIAAPSVSWEARIHTTSGDRVECPFWQTKIDLSEQQEFDALLFPGECTVAVRLFLAEQDERVPEFEQHRDYYQRYEVPTFPGEIAEITIAVDENEGWKLEKSEWHKRGEHVTPNATAGNRSEAASSPPPGS